MIILGIETSCDDTCVAILKIEKQPSGESLVLLNSGKLKILSNVVSSQVKLHKKYGGVFPSLAKREHRKNLPIIVKKALRETGNPRVDALTSSSTLSSLPKGSASTLSGNRRVDLIAVTSGPGLEPCLWVGVNFAKELAERFNLPIVPVNHIEAHIFANWLTPIRKKVKNNLFPAICLVVSGGHTQLILMKDFGIYKILGETRDDAAGECFDKTARILGLGYPGGPAIAAEAVKFKILNLKFKIVLPRPMIYQKNYDFSFSGLKTAVLYDFQSRPPTIRKSKEYIGIMSREIQQAIIDVLLRKTLRAAKDFRVKSVILGGGVAANDELRRQFKKACLTSEVKHLVPPKEFCTDNAAMVATTAYFHRKRAKEPENIEANANLTLPIN